MVVMWLPGGQSADALETDRLRRLFRFFAATQCRGRSLVYETLSQGVAGDDALLDLLLRTPGEQRRPSLLFAAVNFLLASHPDAALAAYYPVHGGRRPADSQLTAAFSTFCTEHAEKLGGLLRSGSTQTNEIRRCVVLRLALSHVSRCWPGPVALVEVGASAGLNLLFDRYRYRVGKQQDTPAAGSPVLVSAGLRGSAPAGRLLGAVPEIISRLGVDLNPVQLADPGQRAWLEAFIWPEDTSGLATLRGAIDLAISAGIPPVVRGDATADTARLIAALPGRGPVVVFTATLLSYLDAGARMAFAAQLEEAARLRPVAWAFAEAPGLMAAAGLQVPALKGPLAQRNALSLAGVSLLSPGHRDDSLLALADPYLRWVAPAQHTADDFQWLPGEGSGHGPIAARC
jgi:hypothetical protein